MTTDNKALADGDQILRELDTLLAAQGKLQFAREDYDEEAATVFGVALLDFMRVHGMEVRRRIVGSAHVWVETVDSAAWLQALELPEGYEVAEHLPGIWQYEYDADGDRMASGASWNHPALAAIAAWQGVAQQPAATPLVSGGEEYVEVLRELLDEVRECFTRDDDLPNGLLLRIDTAIAAMSTPQARPDGGDGSLTYTEQRKVVEHMGTELRTAIDVLQKTLQRAEAIDCQPLVTTSNGGAVVYVECRQCDECEHTGINDEHPTDAACHDCDWSGPSPIDDKCPGCGDTDCMATACPKCGARYRLLAEYTHPAPVPDVARTDWPAGIADRVKAAAQRIEDNRAPRRIPADPTDVDLVLAEVDAYLSGQPAPFWLTAAQQEADRG